MIWLELWQNLIVEQEYKNPVTSLCYGVFYGRDIGARTQDLSDVNSDKAFLPCFTSIQKAPYLQALAGFQ